MDVIKYELAENQLTAEDFVRLKTATGFMDRPLEQAEKAIRNGLFNVTAICDGKVVGMGRLVGDGAMYWYLQEIIVLPEYQGKGIGEDIVNRLLEHIRETAIPGTGVEVGLTAVKGKEPFYEKFGFSCGSSGMKKWIEIDSISERREDGADCESDAGGKTGHNAQEGDGNADLRKDEIKK